MNGFRYLEDLIPRITGGQPEERQHGGAKRQEISMWVLLTQLIVLGPKQVHPQNGVDEEHEEQQAAHIEDSWQGAQQGVEQSSQTPANKIYITIYINLQITHTMSHDTLAFCFQASVQSFLKPLQITHTTSHMQCHMIVWHFAFRQLFSRFSGPAKPASGLY